MLTKAKSYFAALLIRVFYSVWRFFWRVVPIDAPQPGITRIYAHLHTDELVFLGEYQKQGLALLISHSKDGDIMRRLVNWFGYFVVRGSSSRGGAGGLLGLVHAVQTQGCSAAVAVDGPRGPRGVVKPGVVKLAQLTGRPLRAGAVAASSAFVFRRAWNQCFLPWPWAKIVIQYGKDIPVPADATDAELEGFRQRLEDDFVRLKALAIEKVHAPLQVSRRQFSS